MARPKVKIVSPGVRALLSDSGVQRDLEQRGRQVLASAVANCPVGTGALQASLRMDIAEEDRTVVRVGSDLGYAAAVNAGTGFLTRALDAAS